MPKPTILVTRFLFLAFIFGACLRGDVITYVWQGNNGATGSFALDSAWFNDRPLDFVSESHLSAFFFDVGGYIFDLGMVSSAKYGIADIVFDSTVVGPPKYLDGSGI